MTIYGLFNKKDVSEYEGEEIIVDDFESAYSDIEVAKRRAEEVEMMDGDEWLEWEERNDGLVLIFKGHIDDGVKVPSKTPYESSIIKPIKVIKK